MQRQSRRILNIELEFLIHGYASGPIKPEKTLSKEKHSAKLSITYAMVYVCICILQAA